MREQVLSRNQEGQPEEGPRDHATPAPSGQLSVHVRPGRASPQHPHSRPANACVVVIAGAPCAGAASEPRLDQTVKSRRTAVTSITGTTTRRDRGESPRTRSSSELGKSVTPSRTNVVLSVIVERTVHVARRANQSLDPCAREGRSRESEFSSASTIQRRADPDVEPVHGRDRIGPVC